MDVIHVFQGRETSHAGESNAFDQDTQVLKHESIKVEILPYQDGTENVSMESDISLEDEPEKCGSCEDNYDLLAHLEENFPCLEAHAREYLPRSWWEVSYINDTPLLLLDMSLRLRLCLNTGSCIFPRDSPVSQWPKHLEDSPLCFQFYRHHPAVVEHLTDGIVEDVGRLADKLRQRKSNLMKKKANEDRTGITGFHTRMARQMCDKCTQCGLLGPVDEKLKLSKKGGLLACNDCHNDNLAIHVQPANLAERRRAFYTANTGESDHLVALRADHHAGHVLFPANVATDRQQVWVTEGRRDEELFTVVVPTTSTAMEKLSQASRRASEEWTTGLKTLALDTEAPRTLLLQDFEALLQALSGLHRARLAAFWRSVVHRAERSTKSATGEIYQRSPKKLRASYERVKFVNMYPGATKDALPWSDNAVSERTCQGEARRAWNGRVKTLVEIRILADKPRHWSQRLQEILAKTFERDVMETEEGVQTLTCKGGCTLASCTNDHPSVEEFLEQHMVGLARLARIPVVLNYLKAALACFKRAILRPEYCHWDFKLRFEKESWNVYLVGNVWTKRRGSLNEKIAGKTRVKTEMDIVKRILLRPEDMETVTLDHGNLQTR